jgi:hypothetical protein
VAYRRLSARRAIGEGHCRAQHTRIAVSAALTEKGSTLGACEVVNCCAMDYPRIIERSFKLSASAD